jgi:regulator of nucleoside diphosphate kinase
MAKQINVTINDYYRLMSLLEFASIVGKMPDIQSRLYDRLVDAKTFPQEAIDETIVTMNSRVRLRDLHNQRETEITLTYPREALPTHRKISIFSEIGLTLFGRQEKEIVSWKVPDGIGLFEIVEIIYQPEAAGDYHL